MAKIISRRTVQGFKGPGHKLTYITLSAPVIRWKRKAFGDTFWNATRHFVVSSNGEETMAFPCKSNGHYRRKHRGFAIGFGAQEDHERIINQLKNGCRRTRSF
jgi:hypothetical protein